MTVAIRRSSFAVRSWLLARIAMWERARDARGDRTEPAAEKIELFLLAHRSTLAYLDGEDDEVIDAERWLTQVSRRK